MAATSWCEAHRQNGRAALERPGEIPFRNLLVNLDHSRAGGEKIRNVFKKMRGSIAAAD
jgi:hypothetical protein